MKKFLLTIASVLLASMASAQVSVQHQNLDVVVSNPSASQQSQAVKKVAKVAENQRWLGYYNSDNWAGEGLGNGCALLSLVTIRWASISQRIS